MRTKKRIQARMRFVMNFILFQEIGLLTICLMVLRSEYLNMMGV